jgi:hypothetical protein
MFSQSFSSWAALCHSLLTHEALARDLPSTYFRTSDNKSPSRQNWFFWGHEGLWLALHVSPDCILLEHILGTESKSLLGLSPELILCFLGILIATPMAVIYVRKVQEITETKSFL